MGNIFDGIKKNFGFGCMRLPVKEGEIDYTEFSRMIDYFIDKGFNYFDTARVYHRGKSETALRDCLVKRYPRDAYILANKLTPSCFNSKEDIEPLLNSQLELMDVEYFDIYLMHSLKRGIYEKFKKCEAIEEAIRLQKKGKFKHLAMSFHDTPEMLDEILNEYPEIEAVQIQFNYFDYDNPSVESKGVYDVCRKHKKPILVMEPVKGGTLVNLPDDAMSVYTSLGNMSAASYAIRYAASFEGVFMVLSGMGSMDMMIDNVSYMENFTPLTKEELEAIEKVRAILKSKKLVQCTECGYCLEGCPKKIAIPDLISCLNNIKTFKSDTPRFYYGIHTKNNNRAKDCIKCGKCEAICPQHLKIRDILADISEEFDDKNQ